MITIISAAGDAVESCISRFHTESGTCADEEAENQLQSCKKNGLKIVLL